MEKIIRVKSTKCYGREDYIPDCEFSQLLCDILGRKSLGFTVMKKLAKRNFKITYKSFEPSEFLDGIGAKRQIIG